MTLPQAHGRVLLVDDSEIVLEVIREKLEEDGLEVVALLSPTQALALTQSADRTAHFDLVILDVMMPELDGLEVTRRLRSHPLTRDTPILLLTALDGSDDKVAGLTAGADDFLTKTSPDAEMLARVRSFVAVGRMRTTLSVRQDVLERLLEEPETQPEPARVVVLPAGSPLEPRLTLAVAGLPAGLPAVLQAVAQPVQVRGGAVDVLVTSYHHSVEHPEGLRHLPRDDGGPSLVVMDPEDAQQRRIAAFANGAEDYIPFTTPVAEVTARLAAILRRRQRHQNMRNARDRALLAAITDPLTGLYTRGYFMRTLAVELQRARRYQHPVTVLMLDLDHFKRINDSHGHAAGDEALRQAARAIRESVRQTDVVARLGGEEMAVVLAETDLASATVSAERVRAAVQDAQVCAPGGARICMTTSVGVAAFPVHAATLDGLMEMADAAVYRAKHAGRNRVVVTGFGPDQAPTDLPSAAPGVVGAARLEHLLQDPDSALRQLQKHVQALWATVHRQGGKPAQDLEALRLAADETASQLAALHAELRGVPKLSR